MMFEALIWRKPTLRSDALQYASDSVAHAGKVPVMLGSLAAMALLGMLARMGLRHSRIGLSRRRLGRPRATVVAARARANAEKAMPASQNGRRRKRRKKKAVSA